MQCSVMSDSANLRTVAHQAPLFTGFPRQEYWSGLPFPIPGHLHHPGIKPVSPALSGRAFNHCTTWEVHPHLNMEHSGGCDSHLRIKQNIKSQVSIVSIIL